MVWFYLLHLFPITVCLCVCLCGALSVVSCFLPEWLTVAGLCIQTRINLHNGAQWYDSDSRYHDFPCNHWPQWKHLLWHKNSCNFYYFSLIFFFIWFCFFFRFAIFLFVCITIFTFLNANRRFTFPWCGVQREWNEQLQQQQKNTTKLWPQALNYYYSRGSSERDWTTKCTHALCEWYIPPRNDLFQNFISLGLSVLL